MRYISLRRIQTLLLCAVLTVCCMHVKATQLSGAYTIDASLTTGTATSFKNITSAIAYLTGAGSRSDGGPANTAPYGVNGPVIFYVAAGTYTGQLNFTGNIPGASFANTITFVGANKNTVIVSHASPGSSENDRATVTLNKVKYVEFREMTIRAAGAAYGWVFYITDSTAVCRISNCIISTGAVTSNSFTNDFNGIIIAGSKTNVTSTGTRADSLSIDSNIFYNGAYGVKHTGLNGNQSIHNRVLGNTFYGIYTSAIYYDYNDHPKIINNYVSGRMVQTTGNAIYLNECTSTGTDFTEVIGNRLIGGGFNTMTISNCTNPAGYKGIFANNIVVVKDFGTGIQFTGTTARGTRNWTIAHNTVSLDRVDMLNFNTNGLRMAGSSPSSGGIAVYNNIFSFPREGVSRLMQLSDSAYLDTMDYNQFYMLTPATGIISIAGTGYSKDNFYGGAGFNTHSVYAKPDFANDSDLHIMSSCFTGLAAPHIPTDMDGDMRSTSDPVIGADEGTLAANNVAVLSVDAVSAPVVAGAQDVVVLIKNHGTTTLTSLQLSCSVNGGTPVTLAWTGSLLSCDTVSVILSGATFVNGINRLTIIAADPNGLTDGYKTDDTLRVVISTSLTGGIYTIDQTIPTGAGNFNSFADAVLALEGGISGAVEFHVAAGIYNERVYIERAVEGASPVNTITFDGTDAATRILTYTPTEAPFNATLRLSGVKYITVKNLTIRSTGVNMGYGVHMKNGAHANRISHCVIDVLSPQGGYYTAAMMIARENDIAQIGTPIDSVTIDSNIINGGMYGIAYQLREPDMGASPAVYGKGNVFVGNTITNSLHSGLFIANQDGGLISGNQIALRKGNAVSQGIYLTSSISVSEAFRITSNIISDWRSSGIVTSAVAGNASQKSLIANNMISLNYTAATAGNGITIGVLSPNWTIAHNTVHLNIGGTADNRAIRVASSGTTGLSIMNNIFSIGKSQQGIPVFIENAASVDSMDFNQMYHASAAGFITSIGGTTYNAASFKGAGGFNANSINFPARFVSDSNLFIVSGCNKGISLTAVPTDINGTTRSSNPETGAHELVQLANDAAILNVLSPRADTIIEPGSHDLRVFIRNTGSSTITSFDLGFSLNNAAPTVLPWTGSLLPCDTITVEFAGVIQIVKSINKLKVYTSMPNSIADQQHNNDTLDVTVSTALRDTFTIGAGGDYETFAAATEALSVKGVGGSVYFNVLPGLYNERVVVPMGIRGISPTSRITFYSDNQAATVITSNGSTSALRSTVQVLSPYVTLRDLTIRATGVAYGWGVNFMGAVPGGEVRKCNIELPAGSTSNGFACIVANGSATAIGTGTKIDSLVFDSNTFNNGYAGVYMVGIAGNPSQDNRVTNNQMNDVAGYGAYLAQQRDCKVNGNTITLRTGSTSAGGVFINFATSSGTTPMQMNNNFVKGAGGNALYVSAATNPSTMPGEIINNIVAGKIQGNTTNGILISGASSYWKVYHNSVNMDNISTTTISGALVVEAAAQNIDIRNNILSCSKAASTGYPLYLTQLASASAMDHNIFYKPGASSTLIYATSIWGTGNFRGAGGFNLSSQYLVPGFENDTTLTTSNHCVKGAALGVTTDYFGTSRATQPVIGAHESAGVQNDLAVTEIVSPVFPVAQGAHDMRVVVRNAGSNTITSFDLVYKAGNNAEVTESFSGTLAPCDTVSILFTGSKQFNLAGSYAKLKIYTRSPNGNADAVPANDTLETILGRPLSGAYTIGNTGDFATFTEASVISSILGVSGAVVFEAQSGTYNEQFTVVPVPGISSSNTITYTSKAQHADSVKVAYAATGTTDNYVVRLQGASHIRLKHLSFEATSAGNYGKVLDMGAGGSNDSIDHCVFTGKVTTQTSSDLTTIYIFGNSTATGVYEQVSISNNKVYNGSYGIQVSPGFLPFYCRDIGVFNNTVQNSFAYGMYFNYTNNLMVRNNIVSTNTTRTSFYGIYTQACDSIAEITGNHITGFPGGSGLYIQAGTPQGNPYGLVANNVVAAGSAANSTIGIFSGGNERYRFYHNSVHVTSTGTGTRAIQFNGGAGNEMKNNVFANSGAGAVIAASDNNTFYGLQENNNNLYSTVAPIVQRVNPPRDFATLKEWKDSTGNGRYSLSYNPGFTSATDLRPDAANSASWSLNGRGAHLTSVANDIHNNARPVDTISGVPDIGAYEFTPTALPPVATATSAPVAGSSQTFTFVDDTVAVIHWSVFSSLPDSIKVRQHSGVIPAGVSATEHFMYFYTSIDAAGGGTYSYDLDVYYRGNWIGTNPSESDSRLIAVDENSNWVLTSITSVDTIRHMLSAQGLSYFSKYTGTDMWQPLPVKLARFNGFKQNSDAVLKWSTAYETGSSRFEIERSENGNDWKQVGKVKAAGDAMTLTSYDFTDREVFANTSSIKYYRLKMIDMDGKYEYSPVVAIGGNDKHSASFSVFPNPFTDHLSVNVSNAQAGNAKVEVYDLTGKKVFAQIYQVEAGDQVIKLDMPETEKGMYIMLIDVNGEKQTIKVISQ